MQTLFVGDEVEMKDAASGKSHFAKVERVFVGRNSRSGLSELHVEISAIAGKRVLEHDALVSLAVNVRRKEKHTYGPKLNLIHGAGSQQRSSLKRLPKVALVEGILEIMPAFAWAKLYEQTAFRKKRYTELEDQRRKDLLSMKKEELVELSYWVSDEILNRKYAPRHQTMKTPRKTLAQPREIKLHHQSIKSWVTLSKKRKKANKAVAATITAPKKKPKKVKLTAIDYVSNIRAQCRAFDEMSIAERLPES